MILPLPTPDDPDDLDPLVISKLETMPPLNVLWMLGRTGWLNIISAALSQMFDGSQFPPADRETMILSGTHDIKWQATKMGPAGCKERICFG